MQLQTLILTYPNCSGLLSLLPTPFELAIAVSYRQYTTPKAKWALRGVKTSRRATGYQHDKGTPRAMIG
jgi:hypothetical protein